MAYKSKKKNRLHIIELGNDPSNFRYKNAQKRRKKKKQKYLAVLKLLLKKKK